MKPGSIIYGSWKDGSDIYKDSKGYYVIQWDPTKGEFKKYLPKSWKPIVNTELLCRTSKKVKPCDTEKNKKSKKKTIKKKTSK
jgi:hypothetical protein